MLMVIIDKTHTLLLGFNRITLRAEGTHILFFLAYCGGIPSYTNNLETASLPRFVLWGNIPVLNTKSGIWRAVDKGP